MVDIKTVISELENGKIKISCSDDACTTEGEILTILKQYQYQETAEKPILTNGFEICPQCGEVNFLKNKNGERQEYCGCCGKRIKI